MNIVTFAERDLKIVLVVVVICPADTYRRAKLVYGRYSDVAYLHPIHIYILNLSSGSTDKLNFLTDVNTLPDQVFSEPPHIISAEVLILEY